MANYTLTVNSTFQPFTYQELAAPLDRMELYHEKLADEYDKLSAQADVLEAMGKNDRDKRSGTYQRYKSYSDALRKEADNLYKFGLNTESRQRLSDLRRRYNTDIVPIQNAWTKRKEEADMQMKASLANPSLMFTRDAANTSLEEYINNPTGGFGVINGANITAQMAGMAKNLEKQILNGSARKESIDPFTYDYIRKYGLTADMVRDWRNNPTLSKMFEQVMKSNGVTPEALQGSLNAQNIIDKSTGFAEMGMWDAIGEDKAEKVEDFGARLNAQAQKEIAVAQAKAGATTGDVDPYMAISQDIPLILGNSSDRKSAEKYATTLGFAPAGGSGRYKSTLSGSLFDNSGEAAIAPSTYSPVSERPSNRGVSGKKLFDPKTRKMYTEEEFVAQGSNTTSKSNLRNWYRNNVTPALEYFGFGRGAVPTAKEFGDAYKERYNSGAAGYIKGIDISHSDTEDWRKLSSSNAYPIKGYDRKAGMKVADNAIKLGALLDRVKDKTGSINKTYVTRYQGKPALLFEYMEGDAVTPYSVPLDMGNAMVRSGVEMLEAAEQYAQMAQSEKFLNTVEGYQFMEKAKDLMSAGLGRINNSLATYKQPTVNTYKQPTESELK